MLIARRLPALFYALVLSAVSLCLHALPFLIFDRNPLGYDTGFYRRYLTERLVSFPNTPVPGLGNDAWGPRILLDVLHILHIQTDIALYGSYLLLYALLPALVFFFLRPDMGKNGAFVAGLFVVLSSVAYQAFWYMLFKNIFALDVMLAAFIALENRRTYLVYALDVALSVSHATSAVVYLLTLAALFIFAPERRKEIASHFGVAGAAFVLVNIPLIHGVSVALPTALFIEWPQFLWLVLPFLLLFTAAWRLPMEQRLPRVLVAFVRVSIVYTVVHLPFYERIFVYTDVGLACLAAYAAIILIKHLARNGLHGFEYLRATTACIAFGLLLGNLVQQIYSLQPLISPKSISSIEAVGKFVPAGALILTSANEAPWYEGWTTAHIAAPGLLHDMHDLEEWQRLWDATSTDQEIQFLNSFGSPLYISTQGSFADLIGGVPPCLTKITPYLLRDDCVR